MGNNFMKPAAIIMLLLTLIFSQSCGMKKMATNVIGKIATDGMVALEGEEDVSFARQTAPSLIKTLEVLSYGNPEDTTSLVLLSQSYGQYAFGFLEEDMLADSSNTGSLEKTKTQADLFYRRGRDFGIKALSRDKSMRAAMNAPFPEFKKAVGRQNKKKISALFWTAFNWANTLNLNLDDPQAIADLPRIEALIDRVIELDPDFYYGSAHALKGVIAAMRPKMLGGDPELSAREFDKAFKDAPDYLMTRVLRAQYLARQMQDASAFRTLLTDVLEADAAALPAQRLANELAKRRARLLLAAEKKLF